MLGDISSKKILDSGCGSGYLTAELAKKAKKVTGSDFSTKFIELCKKKYKNMDNLDFLVHDVSKNMPFESNVFDMIVSKMVLQYVENIHTFAKESFRVLENKGNLLVVVDHPFNTQFYYAWKLAGKPNNKYLNLKDYFETAPQTKLSLWGKTQLTWYPKTVSNYIISFIKAGFILSDMQEVPEEKEGVKIPRILALKFTK